MISCVWEQVVSCHRAPFQVSKSISTFHHVLCAKKAYYAKAFFSHFYACISHLGSKASYITMTSDGKKE